jgi:hypothetical protein
MRIKISFAGSFQCRLATDPDDTATSPTVPCTNCKLGDLGRGWTFAWDEFPLDRKIRLSYPMQLRNALVDPWEDTRVAKVETASYEQSPWTEVVGDHLLGMTVSFGDAKFDAKKGGGTGYEVLIDFGFSIGGTKFTAQQAKLTRMTGIYGRPDWRNEYLAIKPMRLGLNLKDPGTALPGTALATMNPDRRKYLTQNPDTDPPYLPIKIGVDYSSYFGMESNMPKIPLTNVAITGITGGILAVARQPAMFDWTLSLKFGRFDGDTLTGRIWGELEGSKNHTDS